MEVIVVKTQEEGAKAAFEVLNVPIMKERKYLGWQLDQVQLGYMNY